LWGGEGEPSCKAVQERGAEALRDVQGNVVDTKR